MIKGVDVTRQKSPPPVKGPLTDFDRVITLHIMFTSLAEKVNVGHLLNSLADRVKSTPQRADLEAAMTEFQKEMNKHG